MKTLFLNIARIAFAASPVLLTLITSRSGLVTGQWYLPVVATLSVVSTFAGINTASTATPTAWLFHGLRSLYPRGAAATRRAEHLVARSTTTIKILDTYWGAANQFRSAIQDSVRNSPAIVRILLATNNGCVARIRDAAMPGEVPVAASLETCIQNIEGLRKQLSSIDPGLAKRVEVRRYDAIVMGPLIIVDDKHVIAGTFLQSGGSPMTPAFEFVRRRFGSAEVVNHFVTTFDRIWQSAEK